MLIVPGIWDLLHQDLSHVTTVIYKVTLIYLRQQFILNRDTREKRGVQTVCVYSEMSTLIRIYSGFKHYGGILLDSFPARRAPEDPEGFQLMI